MIGRQLGFSTFAFILTFVLNIAKVKYLSNVLSPEDYGIYTLFFNTVSFAAILIMLGLDRFLTTQVATATDEEGERLLNSVMVFYLAACALALPVLFWLPSDTFLKVNVAVGTILFGVGNILRFYLLAKQQVTAYNLINLIVLHAWLLGLPIVGLSVGVSLTSVLLLMNAGFMISVATAGWAIGRLGKPLTFSKLKWLDLVAGLRFALPMLPMAFAAKFLQVGDRYFLLTYDGAKAVAMYSLVSSIIGIVVAMLSVISDTVRPYILREGLSESGKRLIINGLGLSLLVISGVVPGIYFFGAQVLILLANSGYTEAAFLFPWFLPVLFTQTIIPVATFLLEKENRTHLVGFTYFLAFVVFIAVNLGLGPSLKSQGCAIAYTTSSLVLALMLLATSGLHEILRDVPWTKLLTSAVILTTAAGLLSHHVSGFLVAPGLYAAAAGIVIATIGRPLVERIMNRA